MDGTRQLAIVSNLNGMHEWTSLADAKSPLCYIFR